MADKGTTSSPWTGVFAKGAMRSPAEILNECAELLSRETEGVVKGVLEVVNPDPHNWHGTLFYNVSGHGMALLDVSSPALGYPVRIDMRLPYKKDEEGSPVATLEVKSETEFVSALMEYLGSDEVIGRIRVSVAHAGKK